MVSGDVASVRGQLERIATEPGLTRRQLAVARGETAEAVPADGAGASDAQGRPAAVLMLFGVLDRTLSDHDARHAAVPRDLDVLLLRRATTLRSHAGQVAFPGGRIDPGDTGPVDAALREAREETGLDPTGVDVLGALDPVPLTFSGHLVTPVLGWWTQPSPVRVVDVAESAFVFRAPVADLLDPANRYTAVFDRGGRHRVGPAFRLHVDAREHVVWGFTAFLLSGMFDALGWAEAWDGRRTLDVA